MRRDCLIAVAAVASLAAAMASAQPRQNASGLVENAKKAPGVEPMDYVFPGQQIQLGKDGELVVSYFASCKLDTIKGGTVTIGTAQSTVQGGSLKSENRPCDKKKFAATTQTAEAGAAAKRLDKGGLGDEVTLKSPRPIFRWDDAGAGQTNVRVFDVSTPTPKLVWSGSGNGKFLEYPANAPKLQPLIPYLAEITQAGQPPKRVNLTIDPELKLADTAMNRTVVVKMAGGR